MSSANPAVNLQTTNVPASTPPQMGPIAPPPETSAPTAGAKLISVDPLKINVSANPAPVLSLSDFFGYRYSEDSLDWIPGTAEEFGMFSINYDHYQPAGFTHGLGMGMSFNFLCGPVETDMPPILYNFSGAYQVRANSDRSPSMRPRR